MVASHHVTIESEAGLRGRIGRDRKRPGPSNSHMSRSRRGPNVKRLFIHANHLPTNELGTTVSELELMEFK